MERKGERGAASIAPRGPRRARRSSRLSLLLSLSAGAAGPEEADQSQEGQGPEEVSAAAAPVRRHLPPAPPPLCSPRGRKGPLGAEERASPRAGRVFNRSNRAHVRAQQEQRVAGPFRSAPLSAPAAAPWPRGTRGLWRPWLSPQPCWCLGTLLPGLLCPWQSCHRRLSSLPGALQQLPALGTSFSLLFSPS